MSVQNTRGSKAMDKNTEELTPSKVDDEPQKPNSISVGLSHVCDELREQFRIGDAA